MKVSRRLFVSSATFAIVIAIFYWWIAREITGTLLLGFMAFGLTFVAGYMFVAERAADLWGDKRDATMTEAAGQVIGTYTIRSPLPFLTGIVVSLMMIGLIVSPSLAILAAIASLGLGAAFIIQSTS